MEVLIMENGNRKSKSSSIRSAKQAISLVGMWYGPQAHRGWAWHMWTGTEGG